MLVYLKKASQFSQRPKGASDMRPKDAYVEEHLTDHPEADPHAGCTTLDHLCPDCLAGFHRDMAAMAEAESLAS
jgi:hypothetical protein